MKILDYEIAQVPRVAHMVFLLENSFWFSVVHTLVL